MVLEKICLKIRENAAAFCSEHQNCKENITYVEYEAEINIWKFFSKTKLKANVLLSLWQQVPLCLNKLLFTAVLIKYLLAERLSCNISNPFIDETVSFKIHLLS